MALALYEPANWVSLEWTSIGARDSSFGMRNDSSALNGRGSSASRSNPLGRAVIWRASKSSASCPQFPGEHLVLVTYGPHHDFDREWVWNDAEIDRAKVVWARDMGRDANQELLNYFKDRRVWRVNGDASPPWLESYEASAIDENPSLASIELLHDGHRMVLCVRVLGPWDQYIGALHVGVKAQLGDLYPRWLGTRELLLLRA